MAYASGEELFYVSQKGEIHEVVATGNERNGCVSIKGKTVGEISDMGTLHLCRTKKIAELMSRNR